MDNTNMDASGPRSAPDDADSWTERGRSAERPSDIPAPGWKDILLRTKDELADDHVSVIAAGVAFFGLLATFPAIGATISIAGMFADLRTVEQTLEGWLAGLPQGAGEILQEQARSVAAQGSTSLGWAALLGILLAIYGASKGVKTLMEGMNVAYDEDEKRGFVRLTLTALALTVLLIVGLLVAVGFAVGLPLLLESTGLPAALAYLSWPIMAVIAVGGLSVLYRYGPSREKPKWRWTTPGSTIAIVIWILGTLAFSIYVQNFGSYNETYGALGSIIVLLTWLWLSAYIVLLGAELDSEIEHQTRHDTTTGPSEPMGQRGAVMADTLGETKG
jgi:membrane protein